MYKRETRTVLGYPWTFKIKPCMDKTFLIKTNSNFDLVQNYVYDTALSGCSRRFIPALFSSTGELHI